MGSLLLDDCLVGRGSGVTSYSSDLLIASWLPGLVTVDNELVSLAGGCI